jgi:hypothetical protein
MNGLVIREHDGALAELFRLQSRQEAGERRSKAAMHSGKLSCCASFMPRIFWAGRLKDARPRCVVASPALRSCLAAGVVTASASC